MRRFLVLPVLALLLAAFLSISSAQEKKTVPAKKSTAPKVQAKKEARKLASITGTLVHVDGTQRKFSVQVPNRVAQQNLQAFQNLANLQQQLRNAALKGDLAVAANTKIEIAKNQANLITFVDGPPIHYEFHADDKFKVRTMLTPVDYDDKGKQRRLTEKELKELKGPDPKLPGYPTDFESLRSGQTVKVDFVQPNTPAKAKSKAGRSKGVNPGVKEKHKAVMIVILIEPKK